MQLEPECWKKRKKERKKENEREKETGKEWRRCLAIHTLNVLCSPGFTFLSITYSKERDTVSKTFSPYLRNNLHSVQST